jgi:6-phosphofructokinase 2
VIARARSAGYRVVLDSSGPAYREAVDAGPWLIKPNREEFEKLTGQPARSDDDLVEQARGLLASGRTHAILLSLGADGALAATAEEHRFIRPPAVRVVSAVGAGDSLVGALVLALERGWPLMSAACFGVAAGTAALATPGTELCRREDVERLFSAMCETGEP